MNVRPAVPVVLRTSSVSVAPASKVTAEALLSERVRSVGVAALVEIVPVVSVTHGVLHAPDTRRASTVRLVPPLSRDSQSRTGMLPAESVRLLASGWISGQVKFSPLL